MQAGKLVARQTSKQIDKTERQTIRQTDRQTDRPSPFMNLGPQMAKIMVDDPKGQFFNTGPYGDPP